MEIPFEEHNYIKDHTEYQSDHFKITAIFEPNSVTQIEQAWLFTAWFKITFSDNKNIPDNGGQRVLTTTYQFCILKSVG